MDDLEYGRYEAQVEEFLRKLKAHLMGQDVSLWSILPPEKASLSLLNRADLVADQLLFALAKRAVLVTPERLTEGREWLTGTLHFLVSECSPEDHVFANLIRVLDLPWGIRTDILGNGKITVPASLLSPGFSPSILEDLPEVILELTGGAHCQERLKRVQSMLPGAI